LLLSNGLCQAVVLTTLLYGCETWMLYRHLVRQLDQFHLRCLRKIAGIQWQDRIPNTEVLQMCGTPGIEALIQKSQLHWVRMPDSCIPKQTFFGQLATGKRPQSGPVRRFKDVIKSHEMVRNQHGGPAQRLTQSHHLAYLVPQSSY